MVYYPKKMVMCSSISFVMMSLLSEPLVELISSKSIQPYIMYFLQCNKFNVFYHIRKHVEASMVKRTTMSTQSMTEAQMAATMHQKVTMSGHGEADMTEPLMNQRRGNDASFSFRGGSSLKFG